MPSTPSSTRDRYHARPMLPPYLSHPPRLRTPNMSDEALSNGSGANHNAAEAPEMAEEDPRAALFREYFRASDARIASTLEGKPAHRLVAADEPTDASHSEPAAVAHEPRPTPTPKRAARVLDLDNYDDDDEAEEGGGATTSPLLAKSAPGAAVALSHPPHLQIPSGANAERDRTETPASDRAKSVDDVRKKLQQDKTAAEERVKRSFHTLFYTLEYDRGAMIEQQKLDELDRQVETEMSGSQLHAAGNSAPAASQQGTLSSTDMGASSLTMRHLLARIDAKRDRVHASDTQLRNLISEVRKNRSKWASEDRVGQEELYDAIEKVLMELKASEHAHPFLQRVNKRDAPDYYNIIKYPMDIGSMMKKLKQYQYRCKQEFVDDLMLIWANCLKYNSEPSHILRKKALYMRKETEKLCPLIPNITIRDRAEVEAEERRLRVSEMDAEGADESEDEEPIMASRGRKAPSKGTKGANAVRKALPAPSVGNESTPIPEARPALPALQSTGLFVKTELQRTDADVSMEGSINGFTTPPPGMLTPGGPNGVVRQGSHADASEADGNASVGGLALEPEDTDLDDVEFKTWKQVTKKDRAITASERHHLFRDGQLNLDAPAILRTEASMRRWLRRRKQSQQSHAAAQPTPTGSRNDGVQTTSETLAEDMESDHDRQLPDYYDVACAVAELPKGLEWVEDCDGNIVDQRGTRLRVIPSGYFTAPQSALTKKMEDNMRQMQDTRKICTKISAVRQLQMQAQMYNNQFGKYDPEPLVEKDISPAVSSVGGAIVAPDVCRAALRRSLGEILYHTGFEESTPSALDALTDIANNFFQSLTHRFSSYREDGRARGKMQGSLANGDAAQIAPKYTREEAVLHCLAEKGIDMESLENYVRDDVERLGTKLVGMQERMKSHYTELLRPAMDGATGADSFQDESEQFVSGDFAMDLNEDFFGFKSLGLDKEFSLSSLSVPLHLLQSRVHNAYAANTINNVPIAGTLMDQPPTFEPVTTANITNEIGLVQDFFLARLHRNSGEPLVEDDDLPQKQRFPKPRLPPTGKIVSPRKRPLREQQQMARKKRKQEEKENVGQVNHASAATGSGSGRNLGRPIGKLRLEMPSQKEMQRIPEPEKDDSGAVGMLSPESIGVA